MSSTRSSGTHEAMSMRSFSQQHASALLSGAAVVVTAAVVVALHRDLRVALAAVGVLILGLAFVKPRIGLLIVFGLPLLFREETWQLPFWPVQYGGTPAAVSTVYSRSLFGFSIASALILVLVVRTILGRSDRMQPHPRAMELWLLGLLAAAAFAEILGRLMTAYDGPWIGQWTQIALPVVAALLLPFWCDEKDIRRGVDALVVLAAGRLAFGLSRYMAGGGDFNMGVDKRSVFWDSADGAVAVIVVALGLSWLIDERTGHRRKAAGIALIVAGLAVIGLSYRRQAILAVAVAIPLVMLLRRRVRLLLVTLLVGALAAGAVLTAKPSLLTESTVGLRVASVVVTSSPLASTNEWHLADLKDGVLNVARSPIIGYGFHASPPRRTYDLTARDTSLEVIGLYHNVVLNAWFRMGLAGVIALGGVAWVGLKAGGRRALTRGCALSAGLTGAAAGILVGGVSAPILVSDRLPYLLFAALMTLALLSVLDSDTESNTDSESGE